MTKVTVLRNLLLRQEGGVITVKQLLEFV